MTVVSGTGDAGTNGTDRLARRPTRRDQRRSATTTLPRLRAGRLRRLPVFATAPGPTTTSRRSSSGGITQAGRVPDLVAPGDPGWALCTPDLASTANAPTYNGGPLADPAVRRHEPVLAADRGRRGARHRGVPQHPPRPTPDAGAREAVPHGHRDRPRLPARRAGCRRGRLAGAVQAAMSVDGGTPTGHSLLLDPAKLDDRRPAPGRPAMRPFRSPTRAPRRRR